MPLDIDGADKLYSDASQALREAQEKFSKFEWQSAMRNAQMCIELSVKGMLRLLDIEYPSNHDVSGKLGLVPKKVDGLSKDDVESIGRVAIASRIWEPVHSLAVYGLFNVSPSRLFKETDAKAIIESASSANSFLFSLIYRARLNQLKTK